MMNIEPDNKKRYERRFRFRRLLALLAALVVLAHPADAHIAPLAAPFAPHAVAAVIPSAAAAPADGAAADDRADDWLLKWRPDATRPTELPDTVTVGSQPQASIDIVRPAPGADLDAWLESLRAMPAVEYVHASGVVSLLAAPVPNDPLLDRQPYLKLIGADKAWAHATSQEEMTIALIDTGVDLDHPDLKDNLVAGVNLVNPGQPPDDDNGHGTNVAGVLAAVGNNGVGTAGVLWKARIMPIKALDRKGLGGEEKLGEAIMYAVDHGAKIVVLSVGLYRYSPYLRDIAQYAEQQGALLVAATGNDGLELGGKATVQYPAGYPTVMAVAGAASDGKPEQRSNAGPEVDVAASWKVYTTAMGGGYTSEEGTSMAAPQVAAAAALIWSRQPQLKPYEVRELIRQTARDIGPAGRDDASGSGLLQIDAALTTPLLADRFEPNEQRQAAASIPINSRIAASLQTGADRDWYRIDAPYDGTLTVQYQALTAGNEAMKPVRAVPYAGNAAQPAVDIRVSGKAIEWPVKKGANYISFQFEDGKREDELPYALTTGFRMAPDAYETNDKAYEAYTLAPRSQTIRGTFHKTGDRDWYTITFTQGGTLKAEVETDTMRIDPALMVQRVGEPEEYTDQFGDGMAEQSSSIAVTPGKYYIRVHNAIATDAAPMIGHYTLKLDLRARYDDPNEPNDQAYASVRISPGTEYRGVIGRDDDQDWFQISLDEPHFATFSLADIPPERRMDLQVYDRRQQPLFAVANGAGKTAAAVERLLEPGLYYMKATADQAFDHQYYKLRVQLEPLVEGYRDIAGHWAESAIVSLHKRGIVGGTGNYRFEPNRGITRAEAAVMIGRAFPLPQRAATTPSFRDVPDSHWAAAAIKQAAAAGYVTGMPDGSYGPNRLITRAEIAVMLGRALQLQPLPAEAGGFADLASNHWAAPMLRSMKAEGLIGGYPGNTVRPEQTATRAEFSSMLFRALAGKG